MVKNLLPVQEMRDMGLTPRSGRSSVVGNGNLLQYSYLGNSKDREGNYQYHAQYYISMTYFIMRDFSF